MAARNEIIQALRPRYLTALRKHAIRVLNQAPSVEKSQRPRKRIYDNAVVAELITLWEASDASVANA